MHEVASAVVRTVWQLLGRGMRLSVRSGQRSNATQSPALVIWGGADISVLVRPVQQRLGRGMRLSVRSVQCSNVAQSTACVMMGGADISVVVRSI